MPTWNNRRHWLYLHRSSEVPQTLFKTKEIRIVETYIFIAAFCSTCNGIVYCLIFSWSWFFRVSWTPSRVPSFLFFVASFDCFDTGVEYRYHDADTSCVCMNVTILFNLSSYCSGTCDSSPVLEKNIPMNIVQIPQHRGENWTKIQVILQYERALVSAQSIGTLRGTEVHVLALASSDIGAKSQTINPGAALSKVALKKQEASDWRYC